MINLKSPHITDYTDFFASHLDFPGHPEHFNGSWTFIITSQVEAHLGILRWLHHLSTNGRGAQATCSLRIFSATHRRHHVEPEKGQVIYGESWNFGYVKRSSRWKLASRPIKRNTRLNITTHSYGLKQFWGFAVCSNALFLTLHELMSYLTTSREERNPENSTTCRLRKSTP